METNRSITTKKFLKFVKQHAKKTALPVFAVIITLTLSPKLFPSAQEAPIEAQSQPDPAVHIGLIPESPTLQAGESIGLKIFAHSYELNPTGIEIHIQFDPSVIEIDTDNIVLGEYLTQILPNCDMGTLEAPCPAVASINEDIFTLIVGRFCNEDGCQLDQPEAPFNLATINLTALPETIGKTEIKIVDITDNETYFTQIASLGEDFDTTGNRASTTLTITPCELVYDFDADGRITVADIMQAAALWMTDLSQPLYNGQFDITKSGDINIGDIQQIANTWDQTCPVPPPGI